MPKFRAKECDIKRYQRMEHIEYIEEKHPDDDPRECIRKPETIHDQLLCHPRRRGCKVDRAYQKIDRAALRKPADLCERIENESESHHHAHRVVADTGKSPIYTSRVVISSSSPFRSSK